MSSDHKNGQHGASIPAYMLVAAILVVVTALEVGLFYLDVIGELMVTVMIVLSILKFGLVVGYFMHLKFEAPIFTYFFLGGLFLAIAISLAFLTLFTNFDIGDPNVAHTPPATPTPYPTPTVVMIVDDSTGKIASEVVGGALIGGEGIFIEKGCAGCHSIDGLEGAVGQVGPSLTHIGTVASTRMSGMNARGYIEESIMNPSDFIVDGFAPVMPELMGSFNEGEFKELVDYLESLE